VLKGEWADLFDDDGNKLEGIRGRIGVSSISCEGKDIGVDFMEMQPGSAFPLHKQAVLKSCGRLSVNFG
jgi:hypothetical protein